MLFVSVLAESFSRRESLVAETTNKVSFLPALYNDIVAQEFRIVTGGMATLTMDDDRFFIGGVVITIGQRAVPTHNPVGARCRSLERVERRR